MKPVLNTMQIFAFVLFAIAFGCQKELSFEGNMAKGTLKDSFGVCFPQTLHGTFYNGVTPGADTAYIEVKVNVIKTGSYAILTDTQNGFGFSASGIFNNAGINIIKLKSTGTPVAHVPTDFTIRFDTSACYLTINVFDSAMLKRGTAPLYNWKFTDTKKGLTYKGIFENNYIMNSFNVLVLSTKEAQSPGDTALTIHIGLPTGIITPGIYRTDHPTTGIAFTTFNDGCLNCAGGGWVPIFAGGTVTINITNYDPETKIITGNFSGETLDFLNEIATIKEGEFTAVVK